MTNTPAITDKHSALQYIQKNNISFVKIGVFDYNGILRGKVISKRKFISGLENGLGFCDVIAGADVDDQLCDNLDYTGWHTGYPDATLDIIPDSMRSLPWEKDIPFFLCEFNEKNDALCTRRLLKRVIAKAESMGFQAKTGLEFEFSAFQETPESAAEKRYYNLTPYTPGNFGYSNLRSSVCAEFYADLLQQCATIGIDLECLHTEIGPGVLETAITYDSALRSADDAALFKTFAKVIAERQQLMLTFMAKWSETQQGHSGHTHISLQNQQGENVFFDKQQPDCISETMRHFIGGQQKLLPELLALIAPTVNSFARLVPGYWAPTQASWGIDNRTCALRIINSSAKAMRIEYRVPGADCNPYLATAVALASGLYGIEHKIEPTKPMTGNAYTQTMPKTYQLPTNLHTAATRLAESKTALTFFGDAFIKDYVATRLWEVREYQKAVTDWQKKRYFEII